MQLSLTINDILIPLPDGISLPLALRSPLFCFDGSFPGSFMFNTNLPASDSLRQAVGHLHRVNKHGQPTGEFDYVLTHGILRYEGKCTVIEANEDSYEVSLNVDNGDFYAAIKGKSLKDLNLGGDRNIYSGVQSNASISEAIGWDETENTGMFEEEEGFNFDLINLDITDSLSLVN